MLTRERFNHAVTLLRMRGTVVGQHRADAVFNEVERRDGLTWAEVFDRLRSKGCAIPFSTERGVINSIREFDRAKAEAETARERRAYREREIMRRAMTREDPGPYRPYSPPRPEWVL